MCSLRSPQSLRLAQPHTMPGVTRACGITNLKCPQLAWNLITGPPKRHRGDPLPSQSNTPCLAQPPTHLITFLCHATRVTVTCTSV